MKRFINYWQDPIFSMMFWTDIVRSRTHALIVSAFLAAIATILQAAGGFLPGVGFFISPFATLPIVVAVCVSILGGFFAYIVAIGLLLMLQPAELFIFPFTTGLLGLVMGLSFKILKRRLPVVLLSGMSLFAGISFVALVLQFPLFGPSSPVHPMVWSAILVFSIVYSFIWMEISRFFVRRIISALKSLEA
ncbi:hypothetical protein [Planococcus salinus]|uniref:Uncharacterized protein n=1 Tax=Planococcus salinus TaxID=1848460 RepID=A0A3M8P499_9BACL|nr:hypothetical protein [Planococcus salinus]RNF38221.1 hypothetical protein EEX84_15575 [Planococcus salinus]